MATAEEVRQLLERNRRQAAALAEKLGVAPTRLILEDAARDLEQRIAKASARGLGTDTFTGGQLRVTLEQVKAVLRDMTPRMRDVIVKGGEKAAKVSAKATAEYLREAERAFRGVAQPLALREAAMLERGVQGARASVLRRLASTGAPGADGVVHPARRGILQRYGIETVGHFEKILSRAVLTKKSREDVHAELTEASPFLKGAPSHWATRIARTELHAAYNKAGHESLREADEQLGDCCKILSASFDDRTGADSYAVHGQIRRVDEAFETWFGACQHPPDRPNDRGAMTPHRLSWPIPPYLEWKSDGAVAARWAAEGRKGSPPARPLMTTIPLASFAARAR